MSSYCEHCGRDDDDPLPNGIVQPVGRPSGGSQTNQVDNESAKKKHWFCFNICCDDSKENKAVQVEPEVIQQEIGRYVRRPTLQFQLDGSMMEKIQKKALKSSILKSGQCVSVKKKCYIFKQGKTSVIWNLNKMKFYHFMFCSIY